MVLKILRTSEISNAEWEAIAEGFNESFDSNVSGVGLRQSFCVRNRTGNGYHAIALSDEGELMGYNVFSPVFYNSNLKTVVSGSTFVRPKFRTHEMLFMNMVQALRKAVIKDGYEVEIGVPNHNSEKFALKILKFKPVAELNYYILPFNLSNSLHKPRLHFVDGIVRLLSNLHIYIQIGLSTLFNIKENEVKYHLDLDDNYWDYRFGGGKYRMYREGNYRAYWLPFNESGIKAVYLMDFREGKKRTYRSMVKALKTISKSEDVDMILFVGFLHLKQFALLKCPKRLVPKRLPLTYYVLNKKDNEKFADMKDVKNWDFSLMNFDVR